MSTTFTSFGLQPPCDHNESSGRLFVRPLKRNAFHKATIPHNAINAAKRIYFPLTADDKAIYTKPIIISESSSPSYRVSVPDVAAHHDKNKNKPKCDEKETNRVYSSLQSTVEPENSLHQRLMSYCEYLQGRKIEMMK